MHQTKTRPVLTFVLLALCSLLALPACDDDGAAELQSSVDALQKSLLEGKKDRERLVAKIERLERRVDGYAQDIDRLQQNGIAGLENARLAAEAGDDTAAATPGADDPAAPAPAGLERLLETETGREAIAKTMEQIQQKRDAERRSRMVEGMIDRFAEQADLTPEQSEELSRIMGKRFERMREIWSAMRAPDAPREERAVIREEAMAKMEELRAETDDEVKAVLNGDQYAIYQEQAGRFGGWGGGGGGGRGR